MFEKGAYWLFEESINLFEINYLFFSFFQISFGLHDLLRTNAANIHTSQAWYTLFTLLEVAGAGANLPPIMQVCGDVDLAEVISDAG